MLAQVVREHLVLTAVVTAVVTALVLAGGGAWAYLSWSAMSRLAAHERDVAVTDHMSGPEFEQYVARLLRESDCRGVRVSGGAGDMGADITARTPDGRRLVVQCKRYAGNLPSPDVQRFAGTARDIHGADVALLVTTGRPTGPALQVARQCRITLVDRPVLARWIATGVAPAVLSDRGRR
ncbi:MULTISPECIES: restriction endonuclease [unclassified Actinoplanes]|uniref:restriction endonuclease n=1 Tax=unclassified Actinoplanes TaxID=2626549 RepID=UPI0002F6DBD3|nr:MULTISPECIES: restriction endonuclease [unclassified Actinoplanes]